jgi:hypothetical protein
MTIKYLAIPYSHTDDEIKDLRFEIANAVSARLMKEGEVIFSPISHSHPMVKYGLPGDWNYWKNQDIMFLNVCSEFCVVMLEGWEESTGVSSEIAHMEQRGIDVQFIDPYADETIRELVVKHNDVLFNK